MARFSGLSPTTTGSPAATGRLAARSTRSEPPTKAGWATVTNPSATAATFASMKFIFRRADEAGNEWVGRLIVKLARRANLLNEAVAQDDDAVGQRHRLNLIVGDVDHGDAEIAMQFGDLHPHLRPQLGVEVRQRLVEQKELGVAHDGAPDRDALALPARELARLAI